VSAYSQLSLWLDQVSHELVPRAALQTVDRQKQWDVVIVGAGFTGLWTALGITENDPNASVLVVEKEIAGFGASGRNGGWASALFPTETHELISRHGRDATVALRGAMHDAVDQVGTWAGALGIDAEYVKAGSTTLARSAIEYARAREHVQHTNELGIDRLEWREPDGTLQSPGVLGATWTPDCARIHPAKLVRGLARALEDRGVVIREGNAVTSLAPGKVETSEGTVRATTVIEATEAYRSGLPGSRRATLPLYSLMIATEPMSDSVFETIGLAPGETFADYRRLIIYGQRTADNRIAFGGRGAPYHFGSRIAPHFDRNERVFMRLEHTLKGLFPQIGSARITHRWGGPLGIPRDWHARVHFDDSTRMGRAGGYVGDGVALSQLAGFTLADIVTGTPSPRRALPLVSRTWPQWEPEPLRYLGATAGIWGTALADSIEARTGKPSIIGRLIDPLTGG
jgi:glycine/D-amino acid oxidase-like deaminating enzyme